MAKQSKVVYAGPDLCDDRRGDVICYQRRPIGRLQDEEEARRRQQEEEGRNGASTTTAGATRSFLA